MTVDIWVCDDGSVHQTLTLAPRVLVHHSLEGLPFTLVWVLVPHSVL
jgi:hypothetical protein